MNRYLLFFVAICVSGAVFLSCSKERSLESGDYLKAKGTLKDSLGNCYTPFVQGVYSAGVATTTANKVDIQVNVKSPGNYTITTDSINGFLFKATGTFTSTGVQTIELLASGRPRAAQVTLFNLRFDSSECSFSVDVTDSTGGGGGSSGTGHLSDTAWRFSENIRAYHGYIDTAFVFDTAVSGIRFKVLNIQGSTAATGDSIFLVSTVIQGNAIVPGTYPTTSVGFFQFFGSFNQNDTLYSATPRIAGVVTTINIASYDATTRIVKGLFSGTAKNKSGNTVNISSGRFEARVD